MREFLSEIGVYIICFNEEKYIGKTLESVKFSPQIVVVDSGSTDGTKEIISKYAAQGCKIEFFERAWTNFADQKQFALDQMKTPWALNLDGDEYIEDGFFENARAAIAKYPGARAFRINKSISLYGYGPSHWLAENRKAIRLVKRGFARYDPGITINERWIVDGKTRSLRGPGYVDLDALPFHQRAKKDLDYGRLKAEMLYRKGVRFRPLRMIFWPTLFFMKKYFIERHFIEGWPGFMHAFSAAIYAAAVEIRLLELSKYPAKEK